MYQNGFRNKRGTSSRFRPSNNNRSSRPMVQNRRGPKKQFIHPSKFIATASPIEELQYTAQHTFSDFAVADLIKVNLAKKGFVTPSPIQDQSIPISLSGKDIIGIANTGTGKTAAFAIPALHHILSRTRKRMLIVAPTRELAEQIEQEIGTIAKGSRLHGALLIGGSSMRKQLQELRTKPQIIVGTPGRIKDHLEQGSLKLDDVDLLVLDEVDRMLDMGFLPDMRAIITKLPVDRQSFFFSATLDAKVHKIIDEFSNDPVTVSVKTGDTTANVHQDIIHYISKEDKIAKLHDALLHEKAEKVIVFDDTQRLVEKLSEDLIARGFSAVSIHGGKNQGQRNRALKSFKDNKVNILVATDVAARGIDVPDVTTVINYSTPQTYDDYTHRIGRAGRAGRIGHAYTFLEK